jgi:hypothetical protein
MMDIYKLTSIGEMLAHNIRPEKENPRWRIIYALSNGAKEKKALLSQTGASSYDLALLTSKNVISKNQGVAI